MLQSAHAFAKVGICYWPKQKNSSRYFGHERQNNFGEKTKEMSRLIVNFSHWMRPKKKSNWEICGKYRMNSLHICHIVGYLVDARISASEKDLGTSISRFIKVIWNKSKKNLDKNINYICFAFISHVDIAYNIYIRILGFLFIIVLFFSFSCLRSDIFSQDLPKNLIYFLQAIWILGGWEKKKKNVVFSRWAVCEFKECENFKGWDTCSTKLYYFL